MRSTFKFLILIIFLVERRRRETINEGINELAKIVPGCEKNKGSILQRAVQIFNDLKDNKAVKVDLSNENLNIYDNQAYVLNITDSIDCGVYRAYCNFYGNPRLLLDFTSFPADKLLDLKKKLNKIGANKVNNNNFMFYVVSFNDCDILKEVYTQAREALSMYKYVAIAYGIGIVKIDYDIEDRVIFRDMNQPKKLHRAKINYNDEADYFNYCGRRYHLNDFIRTDL